ncbi:PREDICTED: receptor-like protein 12 [Camelina sativa]|uniref:Receptor-like protein 12 n=1 Tax=Camelina sativa TaxID=90675 RepID=A0ABM1QFE7_CAMSA|nr:PREDICTED: receptor-like protein 12 [Camelina sativa]
MSLSNSVLVFSSRAKHLCRSDQRDVLWEFKNEFYAEESLQYRLWSNNTDCCYWDGISCDPKTDSIGNLKYLRVLSLSECNLFGKIHSSLGNLSYLTDLDLSFNGFSGELPDSINRFTGVLPSDYFALWSAMSLVVDIVEYYTQIKYLKHLVIIDDMPSRYAGRVGRNAGNYHNSVTMTAKGLKMELVGSGFTIYKTIDVSGNRFQGEVPESIGLLKELIVFNMSNNAFVGRIPPSLSNLTNLESLDLSQNKLSGKIPPELGELTFLERMNFSYNRLI